MLSKPAKIRGAGQRSAGLCQWHYSGVPGKAQRIIEEANGYKAKVIVEDKGEATRFENLLAEYKKLEVTRDVCLWMRCRMMSKGSKFWSISKVATI